MIALVLAAAIGTGSTPLPAPGEGLSLAPGPAPTLVTGAGTASPSGGGWRLPAMPVAGFVAAAGMLAGVATSRRRRSDDPILSSAIVAGMPPPRDVLVVFVPGHGSPETGSFERTIEQMGLAESQYVEFKWTWVVRDAGDHIEASQRASSASGAEMLERYLGWLADQTGKRIYLVGHSKGAVTIAQMLGHWDDEPQRAVDQVIGAALLDPPMDDMRAGRLQRLGSWLSWLPGVHRVPSNGGYNPITCGLWTCRDRREHLGEAAGVDTLVIRNTDAVVTNFRDNPEGLRIYDLDEDGGDWAVERLWSEGSLVDRVAEAHASVRLHPAVGACLLAELHSLGSCSWSVGKTHGVDNDAKRD